MRGPHNIWRLVRTGATLERTGAMRAVLDAMEAPRALRMTARILGWPFAWLGLKGDLTMPPAPRALPYTRQRNGDDSSQRKAR